MSKNEWSETANLHSTAAAASTCGFNNKFLFKFGGLLDGDNLNNTIERYDTMNGNNNNI